MNIELHLIQNFAPSNLNRDDTGSPKTCEFGGYRRARISSQCIKRAIRTEFQAGNLLPEQNLATRTKRISGEVADRLAKLGRDREQALKITETALAGLKITVVDGRSQYLLYLGEDEISNIVGICEEHWDALTSAAGDGESGKKASKAAVPADVQKSLAAALDGGKASDLALFGRMLADIPEKNVDAASQVAHAISTHQAAIEFDFYTAVDDLRPEDTSGADMLGTIEFNSACFYRYANINVPQLRENLGGDDDLAVATARAFLSASFEAVPTGKQNSFAAQSRPDFALAVVRKRGLYSLANAFVNPVRPSNGNDLIHNSVASLDRHWASVTGMYGDGEILAVAAATTYPDALNSLSESLVGNVGELIARTVDKVAGGMVEA